MTSEFLTEYGIDYAKGLKNCMGNQSFYKKILSMFLEDKCFSFAHAAYKEKNLKELFKRIHELKGISGNAALTDLYHATIPLVEALRSENANAEEIERLFPVVEETYHRACKGIEAFLAE